MHDVFVSYSKYQNYFKHFNGIEICTYLSQQFKKELNHDISIGIKIHLR